MKIRQGQTGVWCILNPCQYPGYWAGIPNSPNLVTSGLTVLPELLNSIGTIITNFISICIKTTLILLLETALVFSWGKSSMVSLTMETVYDHLTTSRTPSYQSVTASANATPPYGCNSKISHGWQYSLEYKRDVQGCRHAIELDIHPIWIPSPRKPGAPEAWNMSKRYLIL